MRLSAYFGDPDYHNRKPYRVWLDGVERNGVVEANEEKRMAVLLARDAEGKYIIDGDEVRREVFYGSVVIRLDEDKQ